MKHYGDITKLSGWTLPIVDCITGGSPCQDLSVAGKRAGINGERSSLFMEQIRIIREMRERDRKENGRSDQFVRPRYCVWENVPGAFSSNGGRDFQAVLTEFARIAEPDAPDVPMPDNGKWPHSGCIYQKMGGWSIAWRVHDAQFWGVPQRRKRISLVADFGGLSAPEISFERKGMSGDSAESGTERKRTAATAGHSIENPGIRVYGICADSSNSMKSSNPHSGIYEAETARTLDLNGGSPVCNQGGMAVVSWPDVTNTLPARMDGSPCIDRGPPIVACLNPWDPQSKRVFDPEGAAPTLSSGTAEGKNIVPSILLVYDARGNGDGLICPTITDDHNGHVSDYTALCVGNGQLHNITMDQVANTLDTMHDQQAVLIAYAPDTAHALHAKANLQFREDSETYIVAAVDCRNGTINLDTNGTLQAKEQGINLNSNNVVLIWPEVRRLMPIECERLQGYPDGWTDLHDWTDSNGKKRKDADTPRYKACGNSIALPFWFWLLRRISAQYERPATLGSLFDGIGGFPLCWERCNGPGTALWASEIEEFAIAVTKKHFPEDENDGKPMR